MIRKTSLLMLALLTLGVLPAGAQTLEFTLSTTTPDGLSVVPKLTWNTTPAATSCTASGGTGWAGSKAAAGTQTLAAVSATQAYGISCSWPGVTRVGLAWTAPTANTDGSAYTNPGGYRVQWGNSPAALNNSTYVADPTARTWTSPALVPGTWFFGVRAYSTLGMESALSNVPSRVTTADASKNAGLTLAITIPNPPTSLTAE